MGIARDGLRVRLSARGPRPGDWLVTRLPERMRDDEFLVQLVRLFQTLAESHAARVDQLEHDVDPTVAPAAMVRLMGAWIGVDMLDETFDDDLQRRVVIGMAEVHRRRGTKLGLLTLLEILCGTDVEVTESGGVFPTGDAPAGISTHVSIRVPQSAWMSDRHLREVIRRELPASVTFDLAIRPTGAATGERVT